jgi:hypothetical protein
MRSKIVLKSFVFTLIFAGPFALAQQTPICGGYQSEDYGDRVIYTLTDFQTTPGMPIYYAIQNPGVEISLSLLRGACYCVKGDVRTDFEFGGDSSYRIIQLDSLVGTPTFDCWPK